ncbi:protein NLRC5-like [Pocillopora verrucosa]|uniref:protein NLRC5-like n=1 Tax=Pocillopora verrucosa TaxID=203993 RepID=UPI0033419730
MSVEKLLDYLEPKTFGKIQYVAVVLWILIGVLFLGIFADMENSEPRFDFRCGAAKSENIDLVRGECYEKYQEQYNKFAFPVYGFVIMNFVFIMCVCAIYSRIVRPTVNRLSRSFRNGDPQRQENALSTGYKLFIAYCCQLSTRIVLGIIFIILQTQLLYPLRLSSKFHCYLTTQPRNSSDNAQRSTLHNCHNQRAVKTNSWMDAVLVVNGIFVAGILIEIVYIFFKACRERDFMQNSKFQTSHLNPSEESRQQEERVQIVINIPHEIQQQERTEHEINIPHLPSGPELLVNSPLEKFIQNTKKMIMDDTYRPPQLQSLFQSPLGKGHPPKHLTLDQIYTNLVVVPDMADYDFTEDRRKNLEIYARSGVKNETPRGPEDILNHENKNILIVGRPGIGKTLCCTKILRDWASNKVFQKTPDDKIHFDAAFFVKFRLFNAATDLSLRELLTRSTYSPELDEKVWNYILKNPQRVLLIFDGIDEFKDNSKIGTENKKPQFKNSVDEKMPLSALYAKLTTGKLLNGAAVLTTTRPTALSCIKSIPFDKMFEILGFSSEQVEEYVTRFAEEDKEAGDTVKRHITSNINILSLCYIPASCFIICSSLFKMVKFYTPRGLNLPTSLTGIYKRAVKIFYLRHNEEFRNEHFTDEDFESDELPREEEKKLEKLEKLAFEGIKEGRLIFGANEVRGMEDSALFHRLPDREVDLFSSEGQFCFIHLTMQEFFAAKHLTNMSETELKTFIQLNIKEGKWQLVFQFVAGLMENKKNLPSEIITDLLPVKTEERESELYNVQWTENEEKTKVTCWPTDDEQYLAVTLMKCLNENSRMKSEAQRKLQQINFNSVYFIACHLTAVDFSSLVNVINVQQISHLELTNNNIGPLGCLEICKLLKCRESQLSWLSLIRNQLTDEAAKYLAEAINNNNCQLRTLILSSNNISDIGAQHLAEAINNNNCQLRTLFLIANNITKAGEQKARNLLSNSQSECEIIF